MTKINNRQKGWVLLDQQTECFFGGWNDNGGIFLTKRLGEAYFYQTKNQAIGAAGMDALGKRDWCSVPAMWIEVVDTNQMVSIPHHKATA